MSLVVGFGVLQPSSFVFFEKFVLRYAYADARVDSIAVTFVGRRYGVMFLLIPVIASLRH